MKRFFSLGLLSLCQLAFLAQAGWAQDAATYTLTTEVSPALSGSLNRSGTLQLEEGASVYMRTYNNTDYVFQHWAVGDSVVSEAASFYFTMPARDCTLTAVYQYAPGNPANPSLPETTYWLTLRTNPQNAGSFNRSSGSYTAGQSISMRAYNNTDYVFSHWTSADTIVSESASFNYTMPAHDAELTAVYNYQPGSPANPDTAQIYYTVSLSTQPANAGSFSWNSTTQAVARSSCYIYAYENTDFTFREWQQDGQTVSTDRQYRFQMPAENISLVAVYDYTPASPGNPGKNYWNEETGEVIVDDFTPGSLSSAVSNTIGGSGNRDKVQMITVAGPISQYDWGVVNNYPNCTFLDMSRTYGMTYVPSYNFSGNEVLTNVVLPAGIEKIDYYAFRNCSSLSSISVYAATPPVIGDRAFEGIADSIVYVPADAISLYQEAEGWKNFTILPLVSEVSALEVNLPEGTDVNLYKDMFVELINIRSGQKQRYVVTNRLTYTFNSLVHRTSYNVYLRNQRDDVLAEVDSVDIVDSDVSITFPELMVPRDLTLSVLTPQGEDVTSQVAVTWFDQKGTYLTRGHVLTSQLEGQKAKFSVLLPQTLAMQYLMPADSLYEVQAENSISITLDSIPQATISGTVHDIKTHQPLSGATIAVSQLLNGLYSKAFATKTDKQGQWSLTVFEAPTDVTASMDEYVSQTQSLSAESLSGLEDAIAFNLKDISGTTISLDLTYTDNTGETIGFYSDYANVAYEVYNVTEDKRVDSLSVQYPQIVLMEQLPEGTVLRVTAMSKNQKFMPVEATATVDSLDRASVTLPIVQLGAISASFSQTDNSAVVGILYDAQGRLVKKYNYGSATLSISELQDGEYTLVTMGSSLFFNSIGSVSQFAESGLTENTDYVKNAVTVKSGQVTTVSNELIPLLDETKFYYTGDETSVSINKSQITAGNYLTITSRLDFKDSYAGVVSDVKLVFDLPEEASFVDNSVMRGANMASYTYADHRLIVPLDYYGERVRFCFIPTIGGDFNATASAQFTLGGKTITQPIGSVNFVVKDLTLNVPQIIAKAQVPITGIAIGKSIIDIYDNGALIGQTKSLANGAFATTLTLDNPYNLSTHDIYAKVTTPTGLAILSETKSVVYDANAIRVSAVTMYHWNPETSQNYEVRFDFLNPSEKASTYVYYIYNKEFTFTIDFTNNDPEKISNVMLYVKTGADGKWNPVNAKYDEKLQMWVAASQFGNMYDGNIPVNVRVEYKLDTQQVLDEGMFNELFDLAGSAREVLNDSQKEIDELIESYESAIAADNNELASQIIQEIFALEGLENADISEPRMNAEALRLLEEEVEEENIALQGVFDNFLTTSIYNQELINEYMQGVSIEHATGMTAEQLIADGFEEVPMTDGSIYYVLFGDDNLQYVNLALDIHITMDANSSLATSRNMVRDNGDEWLSKIKGFLETIESWCSSIMGLFDDCVERIAKTIANNETLLREAQKAYATRYLDGLSSAEIRALESNITKYSKEIEKSKGLHSLLDEKVRPYIGSGKTTGSKIAGKAFSLFALVMDAKECYEKEYKLVVLARSITAPCEDAESAAENLKSDVWGWVTKAGVYYVAKLGADVAELAGFSGGLAGLIPSGGTSVTAIVAAAAVLAVNIGADLIFNWRYNKNYERFCKEYRELYTLCHEEPCNGETPCPPGSDPGDGGNTSEDSGNQDSKPQIDPSGYVYEGVSSNRVEGVTATAYYKEMVEDMYGDLHENIVLWDAAEYAQENPLFTDEYGMYAWDVPQGLWQVKFEKEGYQTTYSEWLPVPPPQLDVNIPMTQLLQPTVKQGKAYGEGVEVEFDKYMDPEQLTTNNILVTKNGTAISGTIVLLNEEEAYEGRTEKYASKVRFEVPEGEELLSTDEVQLTVRKAVKSYAGVQMQDDYTQKFDVEPRVRSLVVDSALLVKYGGEQELTIAALPADAAKGKKVTVRSLSQMIATASTEELTLDENGQATLTITGELPGSTVVSFLLDDSDVEATTIINVKDASQMVAGTPKASRVSGTEVYRGTKITLSSETKDAVIWYTLDGSCPCDQSTAIRYNPNEPIVIAEDDVTIKAIAVSDGLGESDVVTFTYHLKKNTLGYQLEGWTWLSHNLEEPQPVSEFTENTDRILSQTQEVVRDDVYGLVGDLQELLPVEAYKLKLSAQTEKRLQGYAFNAAENAVPVELGWNWIGYPVNQTMTLDEALAFFTPNEGDYIVGQDGYAEFANGEWEGTLEGLVPGKGYLFKSGSKADIVFNTTIVSTANSRIGKRDLLMNSPWAYDKRAYSSIMPLTAQLYQQGTRMTDGEYLVGAFCGSECRGLGIWKNGRVMMSVYGETGDQLRFVAYNPETELVYNITETTTFTADNTGSWNAPYALTLGGQTTGIAQLYSELSVTPAVARDHITVTAGGRAISRLTLTDMGGRTLLTLADLGQGATVTTSSLPEGMYIVTVRAEGQTFYKKIVKAGR